MFAENNIFADADIASGEYDPIQLRFDLGITLEQLAPLLGVTESATRKWSARVSHPSRTARRLAFVLKLNMK